MSEKPELEPELESEFEFEKESQLRSLRDTIFLLLRLEGMNDLDTLSKINQLLEIAYEKGKIAGNNQVIDLVNTTIDRDHASSPED